MSLNCLIKKKRIADVQIFVQTSNLRINSYRGVVGVNYCLISANKHLLCNL